MSLTMNLVQNYSDQFGNIQRSLLSPTGSVKSTSPTTENWLRKLCIYSMNNNTSDEDKRETNFGLHAAWLALRGASAGGFVFPHVV